MNNQPKSQKIIIGIFCSLIMILTGASDALRGIFLPQFQSQFSLNKFQTSLIIMASYVGNLIFLLIGGAIIDRVSKKKFFAVTMLMWMTAMGIYILTANYVILLIFIVFSLGASTMLSTSVNLITPLVFATPAFFVNIFNFLQGAGVSASQKIGGQFADSFTSWHYANLIILSLSILAFILLMFLKLPKPNDEQKSQSKTNYIEIIKNPACKYLILMFGFYFIAEHGLQNWLVTYGHEHLGLTISKSATYLSLFFAGITVGRLLFAPIVQKFGIVKNLTWFISISTILYIIGFFTGKSGIILICISGLSFSIIYPTIVLLVGKHYPSSQAGIATGLVVSAATVFDITFNAFFGKLVGSAGFAVSIKILPATMLMFYISFLLLKYRVEKSKEIL